MTSPRAMWMSSLLGISGDSHSHALHTALDLGVHAPRLLQDMSQPLYV